jgi:hypothetical protein
MKIIAASIDLSKIDKSKIKETDKGQKYYPITIILNDEKDKFNNDVAITEGQTKDEREAGSKKKYIGNGKTIFEKSNNNNNQNTTTNEQQTNDLPW